MQVQRVSLDSYVLYNIRDVAHNDLTFQASCLTKESQNLLDILLMKASGLRLSRSSAHKPGTSRWPVGPNPATASVGIVHPTPLEIAVKDVPSAQR